ncbi:MAG: preprotein translocase subunit SecY [Candidatus Altiarchaeota archaeon]
MDLEFVRPLLKYMPEVKIPNRKVPFKEKLTWTSIVLVLFYVMGVIYPYGVTPEKLSEHIRGFEQMTMIFASSIGTLTSVGIGPIVTASIILQLLVGAEMIKIDLKTKEGKALFQGTQKILTILIAFFEAGALVYATHMVEGTALIAFTIFQIALGSILLMYMDETVSKWGIGSGISLFIAGGVSHTIITGSLNPLKGSGGLAYSGYIPNFLSQMMSGNMDLILLAPIIATVIVFAVVVYGEAMRIEIPLSYGNIRGIGGRIPLRFFYISNIPVILASALLMNLRMWTSLVGVDVESGVTQGMTFFQNIVYTIAKYLTLGNLYSVLQPQNWYVLSDLSILLHLAIYLLVFCGLCVLFGQFWCQTTGLDSETMAKQIEESGMRVPGFRPDRRIIKTMLDKYIPQLTIISSIAVGLLATVADLMGALGSGTGILLTVGIIYRLYEDIQKEQMADMSPMFRRFMGKD